MPGATDNHHQPVALIGAGGHAKVVADAVLASGGKVAGFYDDAEDPAAAVVVPGATHLGPVVSAPAETRPLIIALGSLDLRRASIEACAKCAFASAVHPQAIVSPGASIDPGALLAVRAVINPGTRIGPHAIINTGAIVEHDCAIGENTHIGPGAILSGGVTVGSDTLIGSGAIALPGVTIGSNCVIGAGAVVTNDLSDGSRAVGVPAKTY
ncbi:MAG: acetyltransferase [bacterium]|nr:acetyltransferase [bacterium]